MSTLTAASPRPATTASPVERFLAVFTALRAGEGKAVVLFFAYAFLLMVTYYVLKTLREPLLLVGGSAELKSYAYAAVAAVLLVLVPFYSAFFRRTEPRQLVRYVTLFFVANLVLFASLHRAGVDVGFAYYVWVGVFGVMIVAQFWAHAARSFNVESGQRLFPVIMAGASVGGLVGPRLTGAVFPVIGSEGLLLLAIGLLLATLVLVERTWAAVPSEARNADPAARATPSALGGFSLVLRDRYLLLLAVLAVLLNCVNTTGEYILTEFVLADAHRRALLQPNFDTSAFIAGFYANYYFVVNTLGLLCQVFLVSRILRFLGVGRAMLVLPVIAVVGYGLAAFLPIFSIVRAVKVLENSTDYSLANTIRHVLYLPLPASHQFEGKTAIDTFFWRLGDLVQAGLIYVGVHLLGFGFEEFAVVNAIVSLAWVAVALEVGRRYSGNVRRRRRAWQPALAGTCSVVGAAVAFTVADKAGAAEAPLFAGNAVLQLEVAFDPDRLCAKTDDVPCEGAPGTIVYRDEHGAERHLPVGLRVRGKWRAEGGHCTVPPLFVVFDKEHSGDTVFAGQTMLPLTTHCRAQESYEQYVLKEYLAYRIYNLITDKSLKVRLVRVTYRLAGRRGREQVVERYAFFTEHFRSLAARESAETVEPEAFAVAKTDPRELAELELFEYLIGNTDWSALRGHNVVHLREPSGAMTAVPYDFDFSGLVDASYAGPPPQLPIRNVTDRLFRGFCRPGFDWQPTVAAFQARRAGIDALIDELPGLAAKERTSAHRFVDEFYRTVAAPDQVQKKIVDACRSGI